MGKSPNPARLEAIYRFVRDNPGRKALTVAQYLGLCTDRMEGYLASMEPLGLTLREDSEGRLYPFGKEGYDR